MRTNIEQKIVAVNRFRANSEGMRHYWHSASGASAVTSVTRGNTPQSQRVRCCIQRLQHILQEIVRALQANGKTYQVLSDTCLLQCRFTYGRMRPCRWMSDQAFDAHQLLH